MWWLRIFPRTVVLLIFVTLLSGCGFRPLYLKDKQDPQPELATIEVSPIINREGQILRNLLQTRLTPKGQPVHPAFVLDVFVSFSIKNVGTLRNDRTTRALLTTSAIYSLRRKQDLVEIYNGNSYASSDYDILDSDFATLVAEKDALQHSMEAIAQDIKLRVSFLLSDDPGGNKAAKKFWATQQKQQENKEEYKRGEKHPEREGERVR